MATLSVDLAYKDYEDIGVVLLAKVGERVEATPVRLATIGLRGRPTIPALANALTTLAAKFSVDWIFIDGPQGWKAPDNGLGHSRCCERELATQGKTGLPGTTKPANYTGFISFSIGLFDALTDREWSRLLTSELPPTRSKCAVESFPTSAWRSIGLVPLPGKASATSETVFEKLGLLRSVFPIDAPDDLSHDELQALVAGLAGIAMETGSAAGVSIAGIPPIQVSGTWREGFIVNPTRQAAAA